MIESKFDIETMNHFFIINIFYILNFNKNIEHMRTIDLVLTVWTIFFWWILELSRLNYFSIQMIHQQLSSFNPSYQLVSVKLVFVDLAR